MTEISDPDGELLDSSPEGDVLDDEELLEEERELLALDRFRPTEHQLAGGAPASFAWLYVIGGIVGLFASMELVLAEIALVRDPNAALSCDFNPAVGCGNSLTTWQSHLFFGIPNALVGTALFGIVIAVGLMFLAGARVRPWFWQLMSAAVVGGLAFVAWFAWQSISVFGILCPWCMVTWAVVIVLTWNTLGRAAQTGALPFGRGVCRTLCADRWLLTILSFVIVIAAIVIGLWPKWQIVFGLV